MTVDERVRGCWLDGAYVAGMLVISVVYPMAQIVRDRPLDPVAFGATVLAGGQMIWQRSQDKAREARHNSIEVKFN